MTDTGFQILMLPLLECLKDEKMHSMEYVSEQLIRFIEYSDELKPFGLDKTKYPFESAMLLALKHLTKAGLVERVSENEVRITSLGKLILSKRLNALDIKYLRRLPGYD